MDGPPARDPERVSEGMALRGRRVLVNDATGEWVGDLRAADDAYWADTVTDAPLVYRWPVGGDPPDDAAVEHRVLTVAVCTEKDWYEWGRTSRRPQVTEFPAYLVWAE